jgi:hypothetical protein
VPHKQNKKIAALAAEFGLSWRDSFNKKTGKIIKKNRQVENF